VIDRQRFIQVLDEAWGFSRNNVARHTVAWLSLGQIGSFSAMTRQRLELSQGSAFVFWPIGGGLIGSIGLTRRLRLPGTSILTSRSHHVV
jgi:hypothetical protein